MKERVNRAREKSGRGFPGELKIGKKKNGLIQWENLERAPERGGNRNRLKERNHGRASKKIPAWKKTREAEGPAQLPRIILSGTEKQRNTTECERQKGQKKTK